MFLKNYVLVFAIVAVKAMKPTGKYIKLNCDSRNFQKTIFQYVVQLRDNKNIFKGTGYIMTAKTLITPSVNLKEYHELIKFTSQTNLGDRDRNILVSTTYEQNKLLSVALFSPSIAQIYVQNLPRILYLPINQIFEPKIPVFTVGFTQLGDRRMIASDLKHCKDNICKADLTLMAPNSNKNCKNDDPNYSDIAQDEYFPQIGDVLVTKDRLVGFMVQFKREKDVVSGEYYFSTYPTGNEFDGVEETEAIGGGYKPTEEELRIINFGKDVLQYTVLLRDDKNTLIGTGYISSYDTIITPSQNLIEYDKSIKFNTNAKLFHGKRTIFANVSYGEFLSVARFSPAIPQDLIKESFRKDIFPINKQTRSGIPVLTLGFNKKHDKRIVLSDLTKCNGKIWEAGSTVMIQNPRENNNNKEHASSSTVSVVEDYPKCIVRVRESADILKEYYSPRLGDVLITEGYIMGIMVRFDRVVNLVGGQYYSFTFPSEKDLVSLKKTPDS